MSWALISGASSGIGQACARHLAKKGFNLILLARREERLLELRRELGEQVQVEFATVDLRNRQAVTEFASTTDLKRIEVLINNAGLAKGTDKMPDAQLDDWDQMLDTNVKGILYLTRAVVPKMIARGRGHIVNVGSVAGRYVYPGGAVYCATKFAVRAISEGLRMDLLGTPIRVTNIEPGMVETEFSSVRLGDAEKAKAVYQDMRPLSADDIAETITWCLSRPAHVNVQELVIYPTAQAAPGQVHRGR